MFPNVQRKDYQLFVYGGIQPPCTTNFSRYEVANLFWNWQLWHIASIPINIGWLLYRYLMSCYLYCIRTAFCKIPFFWLTSWYYSMAYQHMGVFEWKRESDEMNSGKSLTFSTVHSPKNQCFFFSFSWNIYPRLYL